MKLYQIDSFTKEKYKGNPAAVCIVEEDLSETTMQQIAGEMNLSETAFVRIYNSHCNLRWFTPASEVPLCGHATLASAYVLWKHGYWAPEKNIEFNSLSGSLYTSLEADGRIVMDFPGQLPQPTHSVDMEKLEDALDTKVAEVLEVPNEVIAILDSESELKRIDPDSSMIAELATNGVIVSAASDGEPYDFMSRYFAPNLGIKEDPVTGFMHTLLTPYWSQKMGKTEFKAYQASTRGGEMNTVLQGDRVLLKGHAVQIFQTDIEV